MNKKQQQWVDILTGLGIFDGGQLYNVKSRKKKLTASFFGTEGDSEGNLLVKMNKRGLAKFTEITWEADQYGIYSRFRWDKLKINKFGNNAAGEYHAVYLDALDSKKKGDLQGFVDSFEKIPGSGDLEIQVWGLGNNLVWD